MDIRIRMPVPGATRALGTSVILALAAAACGGGATGSPSAATGATTPTVDQTADQSASPVPTMIPDGQRVPSGVMDAAVSDAAARAGVDSAAVTVVSAESVTFPNGGLGCPEPGMMYTDVLTPGYRVVVEAGGRQYDYRASAKGGSVRWCENPPSG